MHVKTGLAFRITVQWWRLITHEQVITWRHDRHSSFYLPHWTRGSDVAEGPRGALACDAPYIALPRGGQLTCTRLLAPQQSPRAALMHSAVWRLPCTNQDVRNLQCSEFRYEVWYKASIGVQENSWINIGFCYTHAHLYIRYSTYFATLCQI